MSLGLIWFFLFSISQLLTLMQLTNNRNMTFFSPTATYNNFITHTKAGCVHIYNHFVHNSAINGCDRFVWIVIETIVSHRKERVKERERMREREKKKEREEIACLGHSCVDFMQSAVYIVIQCNLKRHPNNKMLCNALSYCKLAIFLLANLLIVRMCSRCMC